MASGRTFKLNTGYEIPAMGLGTWLSKPHEVEQAVTAALKTGYRHIDAAACYENEDEVGKGIKAAGVPREQIFITSKLWNTHHEPHRVEEAVDKSLKDLKTDYLDLYLIHWPIAFRHSTTTIQPVDSKTGLIDTIDVPIADTWAAMEKMVEKGKIRSIGVSNFTQARIQKLLETAKIKPSVNQIEAHPYLQQPALLQWCQDQGIVVTAYSPLGNNIYNIPRVVDDSRVIEVAKSLGKEPAQVLINWAIMRGTVVLPKSVTPSRIQKNFEDFVLPVNAFNAITALEKNMRMNAPLKTGVDVFGEVGDDSAKRSAQEWADQQKKLKQTTNGTK